MEGLMRYLCYHITEDEGGLFYVMKKGERRDLADFEQVAVGTRVTPRYPYRSRNRN
jgi:hypothetical protein